MACVSACSVGAVFKSCEDGFYFPRVDSDKCIHCGKCLAQCTAEKKPAAVEISKAYICVANDRTVYSNASSGGVFGTIAKYIIEKKGGIAVGAAFTDDCRVKHIAVDSEDDLSLIQGSKYVQSDCTGIYPLVEEKLRSGVNLVFSGTPCQIAALRRFLGKDYDNLLCVDIVCHGVPSPDYFSYHIKKQFPDTEFSKIAFRTKDKYDRYGFNLTLSSKNKTVLIPGTIDLYYRLFLKGMSFRENCYSCPFANSSRVGDITIGDCGNSGKYTDFHPDKTISTVYPITEKGIMLWNEIKNLFLFREVNASEEIKANAQLNFPSKRPVGRDGLYVGNDYIAAENKALSILGRPSAKTIVKEEFKRIIPEASRHKLIYLIKRKQ